MDPVYHSKQEISDPVTILKLKQKIDSLREQLAKSWGQNRISLGTTRRVYTAQHFTIIQLK
ncbi:hypothetical protein C2G38_2236949 [Gigaspora rosea]|uniref:Uncharacterized protein n=1 Tax=Gigaspora rosea TaxID=44941 RepID=A0A397TSH4_9GLOM|nr:hypothetical protein C2G38_2236949 [Gigaspora rosea]